MGGADTSLGSSLDPTFNISTQASEWRACWSVGCSIISILFGGYTIAVLLRRPWRPTLVFIIILLIADWFKAFWQFTYSVYWLVYRPSGLLTDSSWCQAEGFFFAWSIEMSDCTLSAMLSYVVFGVATRLHKSTSVVNTLSWLGYILWFGIPILLASLAFVNDSGYTNQSTTCYLPVRPFWYRLGLSWIPRYLMLFTSSAAVLWLFVYVKAKHRSFMMLLRRPDEESSSLVAKRSTDRTGSSQLKSPVSPISPISPRTVPPDVYLENGQTTRRVLIQPPSSDLHTNDLLQANERPQNIKSTGTGDTMATESVSNSADEVLRRLRRLWVYPLVYFLYWTFPFIYHAMTYKYYFVFHPVPVLAGLSSTFIALQCTFMSIAVWIFERPGKDVEDDGRIPVWVHLRDFWRPAKLFDAGQWEKSADQRQSASFAKQRLAIEQQEHRSQRARQSAMSSMANVRNSLFIDDADEMPSNENKAESEGHKALGDEAQQSSSSRL